MGYRFRLSGSWHAAVAVFASVVTTATTSAILTILFPLAPAAGQAPMAKPAAASKHTGTWTPSRTSDGQPDLEGIWTNSTITPLQRPRELAGKEFFTEKEAAEYQRKILSDLDTDRRDANPEVDVNRSYNELFRERGGVVATLRTSLIVDPPDGRIPPLTESGRKREALFARGPYAADSWTDRNLAERCITRGAPKLPGGYNNNFQIYQPPGYVVIFQEMIHETRVIPLDGRPHAGKNIQLWMGDSRGHWEGDTLVIDTTNFNDKIISNNFNCCGASGASLHVVERLTRVGADRIDYRYTVDDPATYTRPWTVDVPMMKSDGPLYEYACHEGNYALVDILKGAREQEKAAEAGKKK
jgi:hypothetical protein